METKLNEKGIVYIAELKEKILGLNLDRKRRAQWVYFALAEALLKEAESWLEAGFKNPEAVSRLHTYFNALYKGIYREPVGRTAEEGYRTSEKGYKEYLKAIRTALDAKLWFMNLGMDEFTAEEWASYVFYKPEISYFAEKGWKDPRFVMENIETLRNLEITQEINEFAKEGFSKEEVFEAFKEAGVIEGNKLNEEALAKFKEAHRKGQHPLITGYLVRKALDSQLNEELINLVASRIKFYQNQGLDNLLAQKWAHAELSENRFLTEKEAFVWCSVDAENPHKVIKEIKAFEQTSGNEKMSAEELAEWYKAGIPLGEVKDWKPYFPVEMASVLHDMGVKKAEVFSFYKYATRRYGFEELREILSYADKMAEHSVTLLDWIDEDRNKLIKKWLEAGVVFSEVALLLEERGFQPNEKLKTAVEVFPLSEVARKLTIEGKSLDELLEEIEVPRERNRIARMKMG